MNKLNKNKLKVNINKKPVSHSEYLRLKEKCERLEKAGDEVVAIYVSKHFINDQAIRDWRAAKI